MASITEAPNNLTLTAKAELCAYSHTSRHDCWAVANIKAPLYEPESRVPIDVVAVIDVSGSMAGEKLNLVKKTLLFVIGQRKSILIVLVRLVSTRSFAYSFGNKLCHHRVSIHCIRMPSA